MKTTVQSIALLLLSSICLGQTIGTPIEIERKNFKVRGVAELGFLGVLDHKVQFGEGTTYFDYRRDGGQSTLFPVSRLSLELELKDKHTWILLYQPLLIETDVVLQEDIMIDNIRFPASTNLNLSYGFPFYRLSYLRKIKTNSAKFDFSLGLSLQIRNATISFESADGSLRQINRDVGPVPLLKFRGVYKQSKYCSLEVEVDGIYAPISYLNGSDSEVVGALIDASIRQNIQVIDHVKAFVNLRYLAGGAEGTSDDPQDNSDGYTRNWLHFYTVSAGCVYEF